MDNEVIVTASELITGSDFYNTQYGTIFDTIVELSNGGHPVDVITLQNSLRAKNVPPEVSSDEFLRGVIMAVSTSAHADSYARIIADKSTLRKLIRVNEEIADECYASKNTLDEILGETETKIFGVLQKRNTDNYTPIRQVVLEALHNIELATKADGNITGIATGFLELDYMTSGLQPSDLILIAARPSMGKTAFALNIAANVAFKLHQTVAIFSLEMSKVQLVNRLLAMESHVDSQHIRNGKLNDEEWDELIESSEVVSNSSLIIDDTPSISIGELRSKCRKYKLEHGLSMVMIDYLQLMSGSGNGSSSDSRQQQISEISRSLKALARELHVPVIALSQLSRAVEARDDKHPMLSDLRESGAIEQDADVVMFIYREDYYNKGTERKNIAEIMIAKQRNGPVGSVDLVWLPQYTKFVNSEKRAKTEKD
jgi:replicative DNA helicase